jgi:hypothetical protein
MSQRKSGIWTCWRQIRDFPRGRANLQNTLKSQVMMQTITTCSKRGALL